MKEYCECGCHYEKEFCNNYLNTEHCLLKRKFLSVKRHINDDLIKIKLNKKIYYYNIKQMAIYLNL